MEYAAESSGLISQCIAEMEAQLSALQWKPITPGNLPKVGDEVTGQDKMSVFEDGSFRNLLRVVYAYTQNNTAEEWHCLGYHHFRAINLPAHTPEIADALSPHD